MTVGVVDFFEAINVDEKDRKRTFAVGGARARLREKRRDVTPVEELGDGINRCRPLERGYSGDIFGGAVREEADDDVCGL